MANTVQNFLAAATEKAATELISAVNSIPAEKIDWSPEGKARTALDQFAECALLTGYVADLIAERTIPNSRFATFVKDKADVAALGVPKMTDMLLENTQRAMSAIRAVPDGDLDIEIDLPGSKRTLANICSLPYWNMSYHLGQINYIGSMIG